VVRKAVVRLEAPKDSLHLRNTCEVLPQACFPYRGSVVVSFHSVRQSPDCYPPKLLLEVCVVDQENGMMRLGSCPAWQNAGFTLASPAEEGATKARTFLQRLTAVLANRVRLFVFQQVDEDNARTQNLLLGRIAVGVPTFQ